MSRKTRNLIWAAPLVAAIAVVGALALFMTLTPNDASAQTSSMVPGIPGNLVATGDSPTSIDLTWDAPTDGDTPDGYRLDYSEDGNVWFSLAANHTSTAYTHSGLKERQTIHYRVFAYNTIGTSGVSQIAMATTEMSMPPDAPEDFAAANNTGTTDDDRTEIVLMWDAPDNPDGAPVTKYTIQVSSNGRSYGLLKDVSPKDAGCATGTSCTYTHKKLLENTQRWYRVYAINSVGTSSASLPDNGMTAAGETPNPPEGLRAGLSRSGRMVLYWDAPADTTITSERHEPAGAPITGYYVQGGPVANASATSFESVPTGATGEDSTSRLYDAGAHTSVPLTSGNVLSKFRQPSSTEIWGFRVAAVNRVVERNLSDGTIETGDLEWTTSFVNVDHRERDVPPEPAGVDTNDNGTPGEANDSDDMVERPTLTGKKVSNVNGGRTSIELKWKAGRNEEDANGVNETDFWLEYSADGIDWMAIAVDTGDTAGDPTVALTYVHPDRTAGTTYYYRVFADHENGDVGGPANRVRSEASSEVRVTTAPADTPHAPVLNSAEPESEEEIQLEWTPPQPTSVESTAGLTSEGFKAVGYGKITAYIVEVSEDGTNWSQLVEIKGPKDTLTYTWDGSELTSKAKTDNDRITLVHAGLSQGETKYYRVSTVNNAPTNKATSVPSNGLKATTDGALKADSPGGLVVKADGRSTINLLWNARAPDIAAAPVTGYKILVSPLNSAGDDCASDWDDLVANTMSTTTSYSHTGLMPETGRCYQVFGINDVAVSTSFVGYGDPYPATKDNDAIATTDAAMMPSMPMNVMAMATSDTEITVTWEAPADNGGADITGYMVESAYMMADDTMSEWMAVDPAHTGMEMMYMDTGLMPMIKYYYRVSAMNSVGTGMPSDGMASAMTGATNAAPVSATDPGLQLTDSVELMVGGADEVITLTGSFEDPDDDTLTYTAMSSDDAIATATVSDDGTMLTIAAVSAGMATVTVTASDGNGGTATHDIAVTVTVMAERTAPANVIVNPVGSGLVNVQWEPVPGAHGYYIVAAENLSGGSVHSVAINGGDSSLGSIGGLTQGVEYLIYVGAFFTLEEYVLEYRETITAE